jgi:hypothetical protein
LGLAGTAASGAEVGAVLVALMEVFCAVGACNQARKIDENATVFIAVYAYFTGA